MPETPEDQSDKKNSKPESGGTPGAGRQGGRGHGSEWGWEYAVQPVDADVDIDIIHGGAGFCGDA